MKVTTVQETSRRTGIFGNKILQKGHFSESILFIELYQKISVVLVFCSKTALL